MHYPDLKFPGRFRAILLGITLAQAACAAPAEPGGSYTAPDPTDEVAAPAPPAPPLLTGPQVYREVCIACHSPPGLGGAPGLGDSAAWAPRAALGMDTLIAHALNGFSGANGSIMPRKGGRPDLSDEEIIDAVRYMVEQSVASDRN